MDAHDRSEQSGDVPAVVDPPPAGSSPCAERAEGGPGSGGSSSARIDARPPLVPPSAAVSSPGRDRSRGSAREEVRSRRGDHRGDLYETRRHSRECEEDLDEEAMMAGSDRRCKVTLIAKGEDRYGIDRGDHGHQRYASGDHHPSYGSERCSDRRSGDRHAERLYGSHGEWADGGSRHGDGERRSGDSHRDERYYETFGEWRGDRDDLGSRHRDGYDRSRRDEHAAYEEERRRYEAYHPRSDSRQRVSRGEWEKHAWRHAEEDRRYRFHSEESYWQQDRYEDDRRDRAATRSRTHDCDSRHGDFVDRRDRDRDRGYASYHRGPEHSRDDAAWRVLGPQDRRRDHLHDLDRGEGHHFAHHSRDGEGAFERSRHRGSHPHSLGRPADVDGYADRYRSRRSDPYERDDLQARAHREGKYAEQRALSPESVDVEPLEKNYEESDEDAVLRKLLQDFSGPPAHETSGMLVQSSEYSDSGSESASPNQEAQLPGAFPKQPPMEKPRGDSEVEAVPLSAGASRPADPSQQTPQAEPEAQRHDQGPVAQGDGGSYSYDSSGSCSRASSRSSVDSSEIDDESVEFFDGLAEDARRLGSLASGLSSGQSAALIGTTAVPKGSEHASKRPERPYDPYAQVFKPSPESEKRQELWQGRLADSATSRPGESSRRQPPLLQTNVASKSEPKHPGPPPGAWDRRHYPRTRDQSSASRTISSSHQASSNGSDQPRPVVGYGSGPALGSEPGATPGPGHSVGSASGQGPASAASVGQGGTHANGLLPYAPPALSSHSAPAPHGQIHGSQSGFGQAPSSHPGYPGPLAHQHTGPPPSHPPPPPHYRHHLGPPPMGPPHIHPHLRGPPPPLYGYGPAPVPGYCPCHPPAMPGALAPLSYGPLTDRKRSRSPRRKQDRPAQTRERANKARARKKMQRDEKAKSERPVVREPREKKIVPRITRPMPDVGESPPRLGEDGAHEMSRAVTGLKLTNELALGTNWSYCVCDESRRCFMGYLSCPVDFNLLPYYFAMIRDGTEWKEPYGPLGVLPRKTSWMVAAGCTCSYVYGGVEVPPQTFPPWMMEIMETYMPFCGLQDVSEWPDSCNVNLYENGEMSVGWHADDEPLFQGRTNDIRILSLSLGTARKFELRRNWPEADEKPLVRVILGNGAMCTMEGMMQKHYRHRVPKELHVQDPRINLTWRWIKKHNHGCQKRSYF